MADKTVNVNIKYNVDTSQIQRAQAASQAAQRATDNLRKATDEYGKASTTANKAAQEAIKKTSHDVGTLTKDFNSLYTSIRAIVTAGLAKELIDATLNMARLAGQVDGVARAFNRIPNSTLLLNDLRKATHGTVTDLALMQKALSAQNFRIPLEKLGVLLEFAAVKAQQTGQEVNHLVDYIVSGIGYRSIKRLDDLGFTANRVKEALGGVSLQAASMGEVMNAITKLMNEDLQKTGGYAETAATQVGQIETAIHELQVETAKASTPITSFFNMIIEKATKGATVIAKMLQQDAPSDESFEDFTKRLINDETTFTKVAKEEAAKRESISRAEFFTKTKLTEEQLKDKKKSLELVDQELNIQDQIIKRNEEEIKLFQQRNKDINAQFSRNEEEAKKGLDFFNTEVNKIMETHNVSRREAKKLVFEQAEESKKAVRYYEFQNLVVKEYIKLLEDAKRGVSALSDAIPDSPLGIVEAKKKEIEDLEDALEKSRNRGDLGANGILTRRLAAAREELRKLTESSTEYYNNYLADLSDKDLATMKQILQGRREFSEREKENNKRSFELWLYFYELKKKKEKETTEEEFEILEARAAAEKQFRQDMTDFSLQQVSNIVNSELQREINGYQMRINALRDYYDEQQNLAGDNERYKKELRIREDKEVRQLEKERADREKKAAQAGILVNTALAVIKVFAGEGTYVDKIIRAAIVAGEGATQYAIASRARYYAKGEINIKGPGTETSDSIPAMLSKGESIMTAKQTREAFGILTDIRAGRLNDRIIKQITTNGGVAVMDDTRIVDELRGIRKNKAPDLVKQGRQIYEVYTSQAGNKRFIRSKSI